ncbi:hypothetical protein SNOG_11800 [Parastagonospora nodorum SN15]|uniref:Uncharacterized protein n=1 Tax=Phaeosphaeria nodorum (strain SN15 / ATCC MYA-4574 / FGSC 10173) TaxID=321614 RepID=Q0U8W4_PHANO|nr:hypothetical protein SNOG_11800 [Parastagonospora nodorum SN15]EAT80844.1 hypothetical protein SNOG_11800 [Parastagonospora nodorum SN15]
MMLAVGQGVACAASRSSFGSGYAWSSVSSGLSCHGPKRQSVVVNHRRRSASAISTRESDQAPVLLLFPRAHGPDGRSHDYGSHEGIAIFSCASIRLSTRAQRDRRGRQSA